jgi:hypothetical protein
MMRRSGASAVAIVAVALLLTGCGTTGGSGGPSPSTRATEAPAAGDIPDNQQYVPYTGASGDFSVTVPEGWSRANTSGRVVFTDKLNSIGVEETSRSSAATVASATAEEVPALQKSEQSFTLTDVKDFTRAGGSGVLIRYLADSPVDAVTGKVVRDAVELYLFWKNGNQVALRLSAAQNADNVDPWKIVSDSFTWLK